ncbi:hypothetical protein AKJ65_01145 [candidate division MSBL1 archaeon SCGC-AAA259E19]|uniref:Uncharacterized protein n=1 Tax=candidate division MSBL1 archaeon SCGC-AAA259E19 TaxID=1698264 RepID=A0A133UNH6_9EURY|nr:hypothetical protein AKJ65_01145 [candidate division MSBL1 archaeon SCGC-AAA259E19]
MCEKYPNSVLTENRSGETEVRSLKWKGEFAVLEYLDPKSLERSDKKKKLVLKKENGEFEEYFIIPTKQENKDLLITPKEKSRKYSFWDKDREKVVEL